VTYPPAPFGRKNDQGITQKEVRSLVSEVEADLEAKSAGKKLREVRVTVEVIAMEDPG